MTVQELLAGYPEESVRELTAAVALLHRYAAIAHRLVDPPSRDKTSALEFARMLELLSRLSTVAEQVLRDNGTDPTRWRALVDVADASVQTQFAAKPRGSAPRGGGAPTLPRLPAQGL
jgi:hypothetical protein